MRAGVVDRATARSVGETACPRCAAPRAAAHGYCVECGLRLPAATGALPALRRRWLRHVGWYPGDWIWAPLLTLAVAAAGAAVSVAVTHERHASAATTTTVVAVPGSRAAGTVPAPVGRNGRTEWPRTGSGWTVVLGSYPATAGAKAPNEAATRAARAGLPEVGVLDSSGYSSLHPGYLVVFSGIYSAAADAETALRSAHASGFGSAYARQVSR